MSICLSIPDTDQQITYTAFHKADTVRENNYLLDFTYGPDRQRWKTVLKKYNVIQRTIVYAGNYETITEIGLRREISYINGPDGVVAIHVKQSGQADKIYYPHYDHLGSVVKITGNAAEVFKASYDAWGKRTVTRNTFAWHRGFTGHEHLD
ncbi:MAG: RHS repeat-associated core domain-containing protein, partial [Tannerellaceae bacterium]|nr:RHS repeat-associated core domain-containing protein [Tannerellaceae bacterium]